MTNARDKTYTGKVSGWGLPDGTVVFNERLEKAISDNGNCFGGNLLCALNEYKIKSLPTGYKFNDAGEIVKEDETRSAESTAIKTLESLGYKWNGGEYWRPPLGKAKLPDEEKRYWDGNEPLEADMWFKSAHKQAVKAGFVCCNSVAYEYENAMFCVSVSEIKPVDTRTKKEKAVDEFLAGEININLSHSGRLMLERAYDKWVGNDE